MLYWDPPVSVFHSPSFPEMTFRFLRGPLGTDRLLFLESTGPTAAAHLYFEDEVGYVCFRIVSPEQKSADFFPWASALEDCLSENLLGPYWEQAIYELGAFRSEAIPDLSPELPLVRQARELGLWHLLDVFSLGASLSGRRTVNCGRRPRVSLLLEGSSPVETDVSCFSAVRTLP